AQIAREIASGNGFSTKLIRPAAIWQFKDRKGELPKGNFPDTYHAPLNPFINSFFLRFAKNSWQMTNMDLVYICDKILVGVQLAFFFLAILVSYFTARRLFDERLAVLGSGMLLVCELFWDFSMSGLPQMLMLFLFSCAAYVMVRMSEARSEKVSALRWSLMLGALFGLLALTHAIVLFVLLGTLLFVLIAFRPFGRDAAVILAVSALFYIPWMVRNHQVCGNAVGIGWYSGLAYVGGSEAKIMRAVSLEETLKEATPRIFTLKLRTQLMDQFARIYQMLGNVLVAPVFFLALLHLFKRPETALFRWWLLTMWLFAVFGMCVVGLEPYEPLISATMVKANDLHVLFIPLM
ncbi:MAG: glycosyltransferase family 39 protein, partial [Verrucomicrobiota bacterium]